MHNRDHVTIIGGGVIGLACAYYLRRQGYQVRLIEKGRILDSCASANAGYISPSHFIPLSSPGMVAKGFRHMLDPQSPFYWKPRLSLSMYRWLWQFSRHANRHHVEKVSEVLCQLCLESKALYQQMQQELNQQFTMLDRGIYVVSKTARAHQKELAVMYKAQKLGLQASAITGDVLAERYPELGLQVAGAVHFADDSHLDPLDLLQALINWLQHNGVELLENTAVERLEIRDKKVRAVASHSQSWQVGRLVLAAGVWSPKLARQLDLRLPIEAGKGYSLTMSNPWSLQTPMILNEGAVAITPLDQRLRIAGTMEFVGIQPAINERRIQGILKSVSRFMEGFSTSMLDDDKVWSGLRPVSPDGMPIIGRVAHLENVQIASGHAMLGLTLAAATGKMIADELEGIKHPSARLVSPQRFNG